MEKKTVKPQTPKLVIVKPLKKQLTAAVHKVLNDHKLELTNKVQKLLKKTVKIIVKKTAKKARKLNRELSDAS